MMVDAVRPVILDLDLSTWVITVPIDGTLAGHRGIPDMSFCRWYGSAAGTTEIPDVLVEFEGPSVVWGARESARPAQDQSANWIRITKQLRKYGYLFWLPANCLDG